MIAQKRDKNEPEIVAALRAVGCVWIAMDKSAGFDGIVISPRNGVHIFEIKNPCENWTLTPAEEKRRAEVIAACGVYNVVLGVEQALMIADYL
jgi:hypothetical protein